MPESKNNTSSEKIVSNTDVFADYARYYDLLYRDKDYAAEAEYVAGLIHKFHPAAQSILELGSGTGKHACLLVDQGYRVHGIELSQEMLVQSQSLAIKKNFTDDRLSFTAGDIREIRLDKRFDAVIALFHVISYQTTNKDVMAAFQTARHHLKPGGIFIFDIWYGPAVLTQRPEVRIKRMTDEKIEVTRLAEPVLHPNENLVDVNYHVFVRHRETGSVSELKETHIMRYFFQPEIEFLAQAAGFTIQNTEEWQTSKSFGTDTWSVCFCFQAV